MSLRASSWSPRELLGAHVLGRADDEPGLRHLLRIVALHRLRDAEVDDLHAVRAVARLRDHDVVGLEIAMDDAHVVRGVERVGRLSRDVGRARGGERAVRAR